LADLVDRLVQQGPAMGDAGIVDQAEQGLAAQGRLDLCRRRLPGRLDAALTSGSLALNERTPANTS
jgi:hypothetical protein